jgi:hypothetical protein
MQQRTITMLAQQRLRTMEQRHAQQLQSLERSLLAAAVPKPEIKKRLLAFQDECAREVAAAKAQLEPRPSGPSSSSKDMSAGFDWGAAPADADEKDEEEDDDEEDNEDEASDEPVPTPSQRKGKKTKSRTKKGKKKRSASATVAAAAAGPSGNAVLSSFSVMPLAMPPPPPPPPRRPLNALAKAGLAIMSNNSRGTGVAQQQHPDALALAPFENDYDAIDLEHDQDPRLVLTS